jgi:hypothetical protein
MSIKLFNYSSNNEFALREHVTTKEKALKDLLICIRDNVDDYDYEIYSGGDVVQISYWIEDTQYSEVYRLMEL